MATYTVNNSGSTITLFPSSLQGRDVIVINNTSTGYSGTIITWKVPSSGVYRIQAWGAKGGGTYAGKGARMQGDFVLEKDEVIKILVGQMGENYMDGSSSNDSGGGGGGTFVVKNNIPLIVAGGGGGHCRNRASGGVTSINGGNGSFGHSQAGRGGIDGGGGGGGTLGSSGTRTTNGGTGSSCSYGAGGGGFYTNGGNNCSNASASSSSGGKSYLNGGYGGTGGQGNNISGGFGGGGAGGHRGGGGGGYSGGGGGYEDGGGGGGSYNVGANQNNSGDVNNGHGRVEITLLSPASQPPTKPGNVLGIIENSLCLNGESIEINWDASTDPEGDAISYEIEFTVDGSNWYSLEKDIKITSRRFNITNKDTDVAQFRVRAKDDKGVYSDYSYSAIFRTRRKVFLIQDNNIVKSFKDGVWKAIQ